MFTSDNIRQHKNLFSMLWIVQCESPDDSKTVKQLCETILENIPLDYMVNQVNEYGNGMIRLPKS